MPRTVNIEPQTTRVLLVGIESYEIGTRWDLNGPLPDVVRMTEWLTRAGIPQQNITICLSCLDSHRDWLQRLDGFNCLGATREDITRQLERLRKEQASLFIFYWGGHGYISTAGDRRLFCADTREQAWHNLDFNDLLQAMRTDFYQGLPKQLFIVDTCANYATGEGFTPANYQLDKGEPIPVEQFVLFAAKLGQVATNLNQEETGIYTRELLGELEKAQGVWPPDMDEIARNLERRFLELRQQGLTHQTPTYLRHLDWGGNDRSYSQMSAGGGNNIAIAVPRKLQIKEVGRLRDLFLACPAVSSSQSRDEIIQMLRPEIFRNINRASNLNTEIFSIIETVRSYSGGVEELLEAINFFESDSQYFQALEQGIREILF